MTLSDDDKQAILNDFDSDWRGNFLFLDLAWNFYQRYSKEKFEQVIKRYER